MFVTELWIMKPQHSMYEQYCWQLMCKLQRTVSLLHRWTQKAAKSVSKVWFWSCLSMVGYQTATVISVDLHPVQFSTKTDDLLVATFLCKKLVQTHNCVPHSEGLCLHPVQEPQKETNAFHSSHGATHQGASKRLIFSRKSFSILFCTALLFRL